jgi:hypothetical protein
MPPITNAPAPVPTAIPTQSQGLDPQVVAMAKAIRETESGNKPVQGPSGETGRYQFMPGTWHAGAAQYLGDGNAPQTLENENKVAYSKIKAWKDQGYNPGQIASLWNSGSPDFEGKVGTNKFGVHYDTPAYVQKVYGNYQRFKPQEQVQSPDQNSSVPQQQPQSSILDKVEQATNPAQLGIGALKGVGSTVAGLASLGEKLITRPIDKAVSFITGKKSPLAVSGPTEGENFSQQYLQANGLGQQIGKGAEQIGELLLPTGLEEAGANLASKIAPEAPKLAQGALKLGGKALGGAIDFGGKEALQSGGDVQKTRNAALLGGAGVAALEGAGSIVKPIAKGIKDLVNPDMETAFIRGVAPTGSKALEFGKSARMALPDLVQTAKEAGRDITKSEKPIQDILDTAKEAKVGIWQQFKNLMGGYGNFTIDGNKIADEMVSSMDKRFIEQNPGAAKAITEKAALYRRPMTLEEAENYLESTNGELNTYYAKNKVGRLAAMRDPEVSHVVKEADALRSSLYSKLDEATGKGADAKLLKQRYGALTEVQNQLLKRQAQVARIKPISLAEQINYPMALAKGAASALRGDILGAGEGLAQAAGSKAIKESQTADTLLRKAFGAAEKQGVKGYGVVKPPAPMTTNLLEAPKTIFGQAPLPVPSRVLSQAEAKAGYENIGKATEANVKARAQTLGERLTAGHFNIEDTQITKNAKGQFFLKKKGFPATKIGMFEARILEQAGYPIVGE